MIPQKGQHRSYFFNFQPDFMKSKMRFIKLLYILILLSAYLPVAAKTINETRQVTGKITDKATSLPIPGVTITIPDLKIGTSTDENGIYVLKQLPKGKYLIQVSMIGYASVTKLVDLGNTYSVDFKLSASNYELSDVIVTSLGNTTTRQQATIPITVSDT